MTAAPYLERSLLRAGMRVVVAVSGGADSVGLLRALGQAAPEMGLALSVAHLHHGIRGAEADADEQFVTELADRLGLPLNRRRVNAPTTAKTEKKTLEEAARHLRYAWFRELLAQGRADAVATAHTLDDQAETVLHRLIRGAWTEGLGGIHPVVACPGGAVLRPFLKTSRAEILAWLRVTGQPWREDASNQDPAFTRSRIRHELLPQLAEFNPRIAEQLARLATIARDEESWWDTELSRLLPQLALPGRPVRGGGRAVSTQPGEGSVGLELSRVRALAPALRRRVLRAAALQLGCALNFGQTERLMAMCEADGSRRQQLTGEVRAARSARELRLVREAPRGADAESALTYELPIPGEVSALGLTLRARLRRGTREAEPVPAAILRTPRPGDRVRLRYSRAARSLKDVFSRLGDGTDAEARKTWPVLEWQGRIVWMKGAVLEPEAETPFDVEIAADQ
ncbi:MAG TPA: tRNA lysidine(34) synthetase TilS [Acidobacteriaceae bacterium]|nr:tRNA lysidine(34) synthetase TilS [Acidobacteriaceae bacterium]